ncbi:MAG TPA: lysophospholipid acyltransferase family protein [Candidatus Limnocylindrales bacterium]
MASRAGDAGAAAGLAVEGGAGTLAQRGRARLVAGLAWLACRLPERPLIGLASVAGEAWYRLAPARAARARRNLQRVATWLDAAGLGPAAARAAARDRAALERLVRSAFRHQARYYLELLRVRTMTRAYVRERLVIETPEAVAEAFAERPLILVGLHFGAIELPSLMLVTEVGRPTAPMETIADGPLQRYIASSRAAVGINLVAIRRSRSELLAAIRRGEPVGLVADRDIAGGGLAVELFGAPARLPIGPALLALEAGGPLNVAAVRRTAPGRYAGRLERLPLPPAGSHRERVTALLEAEARAFERVVATAPAQWWAVFFPIWPDLETVA